MKRCSKQILAAVMCAAVLTVSAPITTYADSTLDHLNGQYSELEKQQQALKDKLNQTKTEKEKQEAIRNNLNNQITNTQKQITLLDNKINYLQNDIADKEERINELSTEVLEQQDLFMKRIRSIYKTSVGTSMLGMVFGVDSLGSYLSYGKYLSRISEHDSALLQALADNITELRDLQVQMQAEKEDLADTKVTAESKKASLTSQKTEVESTLQDIKKMEQEYLADQAAIQKEMKQIQADIDAIYAANAGNGSQVDYSTTGFIYPVKGYTYISSYYGWRFNNTDYHTGVDFPAPANTPIRASASGTVIYVRTGAGYGRAYAMLCDAAGIPAVYVASEQMNHGWNAVRLDGRTWFIDCTFDDPIPDRGEYVSDQYFMLTGDELAQTHTWNETFYEQLLDSLEQGGK